MKTIQSPVIARQRALAQGQTSGQAYVGEPLRVLIVPGLHDSGAGHWQTWLQHQYRGAVRVHQADWSRPDLPAWSARIAATVDRARAGTRFVAVAHSFGCLALARLLMQSPAERIVAALLVAPASPARFGLADALLEAGSVPAHASARSTGLGRPTLLAGSETDPWMPLGEARWWAEQWGSRFVNLGAAGHVNVESGYGPWPMARFWVDSLLRDQQRRRRIERAHALEFGFAI